MSSSECVYNDTDGGFRDDLALLPDSNSSSNYTTCLSKSLIDDATSRNIFINDDVKASPEAQSSKVVFALPDHEEVKIKHSVPTDRKLLKYSSETSFIETNSESSNELERITNNRKLRHLSVHHTSTFIRANGGNSLFNRIRRHRQHESDSGSIGSETTVASGIMTPVERQRDRFRIGRPKSAGQMSYSDANSSNAITLQSLDSFHPFTVKLSERDETSDNAYNMDDDSAHEFDEKDGKPLYIFLSFPQINSV